MIYNHLYTHFVEDIEILLMVDEAQFDNFPQEFVKGSVSANIAQSKSMSNTSTPNQDNQISVAQYYNPVVAMVMVVVDGAIQITHIVKFTQGQGTRLLLGITTIKTHLQALTVEYSTPSIYYDAPWYPYSGASPHLQPTEYHPS